MSTDPRPQPTDDQDAEIGRYRALSASAVVSLIFGLLSPLAIVDWLLWIIPLLGMVFGLRALWCIAQRAPELAGRRAAVLGLLLSVLFGAMGVTDKFAHRWMLHREARQFAEAWLQYLVGTEPEKAFQLTIHPRYRQKLDLPIWSFYREGPRWQRKLEAYVKDPLVRTLLALGPETKIRYYETAGQELLGKKLTVRQVYAVTFDDEEGRRKSFFVGVEIERNELGDGTANWRIRRAAPAPLPKAFLD